MQLVPNLFFAKQNFLLIAALWNWAQIVFRSMPQCSVCSLTQKPYPDQKAYIESLLVTTDSSARDVLSQSYDSMMVMAMALNASVEHLAKMEPPRRLQDFQYGDTAMREVIMQSVRNVHFYGATVSYTYA